jgi:hypothetical protein
VNTDEKKSLQILTFLILLITLLVLIPSVTMFAKGHIADW